MKLTFCFVNSELKKKDWKTITDEFTMCQTWEDINTSGIHLESLQGLTIYGRLVVEICEN